MHKRTLTPSVSWPLPMVAPEAVGLCPQRLARADAVVRDAVTRGVIAGAVTLAVRRGGIAQLACHGLADIERQLPMRQDAIFRIYSMSKIVTTVGVLMLMEEGRFLLGEPVARFLPAFADLRVSVPPAEGREEPAPLRRPITIHDLLTHLSGIDYTYYREAREQGLDLAAFVAGLCQRPLSQQPGERWMYGASVDVCGRLIEMLTGQTFDRFLQERIFGPLGMTDTGFCVPAEQAHRLAAVYQPEAGAAPAEQMVQAGWSLRPEGRLVPAETPATSPFLNQPPFLSGGGGLVSTTVDYLRFSLMLLGRGAFNGVRLLSPKTVALMCDDHLPPGHPPLAVNNRGFGLGVSVLRRLGETRELGSVGEFGWGGAACTQVWIDPAEEMITMIMPQYRPKGKFPLMDLYKQAVYQAII